MATETKEEGVGPAKTPRTRSPNYPAFDLEESLNKAEALYQANDRHFTQWEAAARQLDYSPKSSSFGKAIGALTQFGLIEDKGRGDSRQIKVSDRYLDITLNPPGNEQRAKAIKEAALAPKLHSEIWEKYEKKLPPTDDSIRYYLLREREDGTFNRSSVDAFIDQFRKTLKFAGIHGGDENKPSPQMDTSKNGNDPNAQSQTVQVGSFVQWTSAGVDQFPQPKKVLGIEGDWVFVEGSQTGVPMTEVTVVDSPVSPPANPYLSPPQPEDEPVAPGTAKEITTLEEGPVTLLLPKGLSADSVSDLDYWVQGILKKYRRAAGLSEK